MNMYVHLALGAALIIFGTGYTEGCGSGWIQPAGSKSCYKFVTEDLKSWPEAQGMCRDMGGYLANLETMDEIYWLRGYRSFHSVLRPGWLFIGGYRENGKWFWKGDLTNSAVTASDWGGNEPHEEAIENCMALFGDDQVHPVSWWFRWLNIGCDRKLGYVCEKNL